MSKVPDYIKYLIESGKKDPAYDEMIKNNFDGVNLEKEASKSDLVSPRKNENAENSMPDFLRDYDGYDAWVSGDLKERNNHLNDDSFDYDDFDL